MKRHLANLFAALALLFIPLTSSAQQTVFTKKARLADFTTKTTKVVLSGNEILDAALKEEVMSAWRLSPYEFCSAEEFNTLKTSSKYFFLHLGISDANPGLAVLTIIKGGKADDSVDAYYEVMQMPFADAQTASGKGFIYMGAYLDIIQRYLEDAINSDLTGYKGLEVYNKKPKSYSDKEIYIAREDLGRTVNDALIEKVFGDNLHLCSADEVDSIFLEGRPDAVVGVLLVPNRPVKGSFCYKMLITADSHELLMFEKKKCDLYAYRGFQDTDIKEIEKARNRKK